MLQGFGGYVLTARDTLPHQNFHVLSVKAMQQVLCGGGTATVLPVVFHCVCIHNSLEGSVKGVRVIRPVGLHATSGKT